MAKLILTFHGNTVSETELEKEYTTIGRKPDNDIQIDNLAVSGHHARVIRILNDYFLEDLDSTNGTTVNGTDVKKHALNDGDRIDIGKHQLRFVNEDQGESADDLEKTVVMSFSSMSNLVNKPVAEAPAARPNASAEAAPEPPPAAAPQPSAAPATEPEPARLQILSGPNSGRELKLVKEVTTLGKKGVQVVAITRRHHGYFMVQIDGGPNNDRELKVNGNVVGPQAYHLRDQDVVEMAGVKMGFFLED
ncbi:MAG: FHA domain-containing protein [Gammaproteobacteria bacterium]|nr:FHA domain-containing protein [Gammaproteobacteria bacterium]